jgi:hypothetical protein
MLPGLWASFHFQFLGPVVIDRPQLLKWSVIVAPQPVYSAARFTRALCWPQTRFTPRGDVRRHCPFTKSFKFCSYANCPILHYFGANKSFRIRSYRHPVRNPFRFRSHKHPGGWHPLPSNSVHRSGSVSLCLGGKSSPALFRLSTLDCRPAASSLCLRAPVANRLLFLASGLFSISFRINTCISVASKQLYPPLESTLVKKPGEGGGCVSTPNPTVSFPQQALNRSGRGGKLFAFSPERKTKD